MDDPRHDPAWQLGYLTGAVDALIRAYDERRDIDEPIERLRNLVRGDESLVLPSTREGA